MVVEGVFGYGGRKIYDVIHQAREAAPKKTSFDLGVLTLSNLLPVHRDLWRTDLSPIVTMLVEK
jgi:hypothetical protein